MELDEIRKTWTLKENNRQAKVDLWDSMAQSFSEYTVPTASDDDFMRLITSKNFIQQDSLVLDVGCGTGPYSIALADRCRAVTGVDLSPKMIAIAGQKAEEYKAENVAFSCADWLSLDLAAEGFEKKFDFVFAHRTPAVQSAATFEKLINASRGWCAISKPVHRTDPVSDAVKARAGISANRESSERDIALGFELLWKRGFLPFFQYNKEHWHMEKTPEEAYGLYINRVKAYRDLSAGEEEDLKEYIRSFAENGVVIEDVDTTIATMYWHV